MFNVQILKDFIMNTKPLINRHTRSIARSNSAVTADIKPAKDVTN
jgi:ribosomal protein S7